MFGSGEYSRAALRLVSEMGKLSIAMAALGAMAQWLPIVRGCTLAMRLFEGVAAVHPSSSLAARTQYPRAASIVAIGLRVTLVASLGMLVGVLPALAYGSPPDPSWIQGVYDDADYDDVVTLAISTNGNFAPGGGAALLPVDPVVWTPLELPETIAHGRPTRSAPPRAPPAS
jgi:hypothetical protein